MEIKDENKVYNHYLAEMALLGEELKLLSQFNLPSREGFNITVKRVEPGFTIEDVSQILADSTQGHTERDIIEKSSEQTTRPDIQDRFSLTREVIENYFDFDPRIPIKHDTEKIGRFEADRYLIEFKYKGESITLIVTNWYGYAIYLTKSCNYNSQFNRETLRDNGAKRINWNDEKVTHDSLYSRIQTKLDDLVA